MKENNSIITALDGSLSQQTLLFVTRLDGLHPKRSSSESSQSVNLTSQLYREPKSGTNLYLPSYICVFMYRGKL
jgi:hypothetical protein